MLFISSKKLFRFSRYSNFVFLFSHLFLPVSYCWGWSKINLKVCDAINFLNENLITHFVWYLVKEKRYQIETLSTDRVLNKEHLYCKMMQKNVHEKLVPDLSLILVNNPKQPLHARNSFKNKILWKRIIKKPWKS